MSDVTWEPLGDGMYHTDGPEVFRVEGERLEVYQGSRGAWVNLPAGRRLCRQVEVPAKPAVVTPVVPDEVRAAIKTIVGAAGGASRAYYHDEVEAINAWLDKLEANNES